jgi:hypothetical protein
MTMAPASTMGNECVPASVWTTGDIGITDAPASSTTSGVLSAIEKGAPPHPAINIIEIIPSFMSYSVAHAREPRKTEERARLGGMPLSPTVKLIAYLVLTAIGAVLMKLETLEPAWSWVGMVAALVGALLAGLNPTPTQARALVRAKEEGKNEGVQLALRSKSPDAVTRGFVRMPALFAIMLAGAITLACAANPGPPPGPVITDFANLVSCVVSNIGNWAALLLQCGQWTIAEIVAAIDWLTANPKAQAAYNITPDQMAKLHEVRAALVAKMAAADGGAK